MRVHRDIDRRAVFFGMLGGMLATMPAAGAAPMPAPLVMIDPGHGGKDPGTTGPDGVHEKTITLLVGLDLRQALLASGKFRVAMTRMRDVFVSLADRVAMAERAQADAFVSLHCNHLPDPALRGALVFTLSRHPSDALAAAIARTENSYDHGPLLPRFRGVTPQVGSILGRLELHATERAARNLAHDIVTAMRGDILLLPDPRRSADFAVLRDPVVPSTLIEMGCLSNFQDEALLQTLAYRKLMASRIAGGFEVYFSSPNPERVAG